MIGVSIVTYRSERRALVETLRGVARQTSPPQVVRLHANSGSHSELAELREAVVDLALPLALTSSEDNLGFCEAHNRALTDLFGAGCAGVLVLNPDLVLDRDALARLAEAAQDDPHALYGPVLELADPQTLEPTGLIDTVGTRWARGARHLDERQGEPMRDLPKGTTQTASVSGACLFVTAEAFAAITQASGEFFDADFFAYREDAELGFRAALLGLPSRIVGSAHGLHVRRLRGTSRQVDPFVNALGVRNRFLFAAKYGLRRPGGAVSAVVRDVVVLVGVVVAERTSIPALRDAWRLRHTMRAKRDLLEREIAARRR